MNALRAKLTPKVGVQWKLSSLLEEHYITEYFAPTMVVKILLLLQRNKCWGQKKHRLSALPNRSASLQICPNSRVAKGLCVKCVTKLFWHYQWKTVEGGTVLEFTVFTTLFLQVLLSGWGRHVHGGGPATRWGPPLPPAAKCAFLREYCHHVCVRVSTGPRLPALQAHHPQVRNTFCFLLWELSFLLSASLWIYSFPSCLFSCNEKREAVRWVVLHSMQH